MYELKTERLKLRGLKFDDDFFMYEYAKTDSVGPYAGWHPHKNIYETRQLIMLMIQEKEVWAITKKEDDNLIGTIGLHLIEGSNDPRERKLGFALNPMFWNLGIMTEAAKAVLKYAFEVIKLNKIIVKHYSTNIRSQSVINKLGFKLIEEKEEKDYKGSLEKMKYYEITRSDYNDKIKR